MNEVIGYYRYEGYPLEQKIAWIRQGAGAGALRGAQEALEGLTEALVESEQRLRELVTRLGGSWTGAAADSAGASVRQAMTWSGDSGQVTGEAKTSADLQAERVALTRNLTPGCAPGTAEYGFDDALADSFNATSGGLFDVQTNFDEQAARRKAVDDEVNRTLYAHEAASRANLDSVPALAEVPRVTSDSVPPATTCLPIAPVPVNDHQPPTVGEPDGKRDSEDRKQDDRKQDDPKRGKDEDGQKTKQDNDDKPGQVEPEPERERTTAAAHTATPPEVKQPVPEPPREQQQQNTRPSSVHNGLPAPVGRIGGPISETGRTSGAAPRTTTPVTGRAGTGRVGAGRVGAGSTGVVSSTVKGREAVTSGGTPGNRAGVQHTSPHSPARAGAPGHQRAGQLAGAGYGPQGAAAREEDAEHTDKYYQDDDGLFDLGDLRGIAPAVLGEEPE